MSRTTRMILGAVLDLETKIPTDIPVALIWSARAGDAGAKTGRRCPSTSDKAALN